MRFTPKAKTFVLILLFLIMIVGVALSSTGIPHTDAANLVSSQALTNSASSVNGGLLMSGNGDNQSVMTILLIAYIALVIFSIAVFVYTVKTVIRLSKFIQKLIKR